MRKIIIELSKRVNDHWIEYKFENGQAAEMAEVPKYHAQIKDNPEIWACGRNPDESIGNLIRSHQESFGIEVIEIIEKSKHQYLSRFIFNDEKYP